MNNNEINNYQALNSMIETESIVLFGNTADRGIPVTELASSFKYTTPAYNRSLTDLSLEEASDLYEACVAPLCPESVLVHLGESDLELFKVYPAGFDTAYGMLISTIRKNNKKCRIALISIVNPENNKLVEEMNKHIEYIANANKCEYCDISNGCQEVTLSSQKLKSFIYGTGFVSPLKIKRPNYDLVKILFGYTANAAIERETVIDKSPAIQTNGSPVLV